MKFNREHLEKLTLQKIKEVNDEAGYRKYLEVPEMVELVAQGIEEMLPAMVREWVERAMQAEEALSELRDRHAETLETLM
jgi:hypothetical protein